MWRCNLQALVDGIYKIADLEGPRIVDSNGLGHVSLSFVRLALALEYQQIVILKTKAANK